MNRSHQGQQHEPESMSDAAPLVVPLDTLDRTSLPVAGAKAANLGELIHAGFAVRTPMIGARLKSFSAAPSSLEFAPLPVVK